MSGFPNLPEVQYWHAPNPDAYFCQDCGTETENWWDCVSSGHNLPELSGFSTQESVAQSHSGYYHSPHNTQTSYTQESWPESDISAHEKAPDPSQIGSVSTIVGAPAITVSQVDHAGEQSHVHVPQDTEMRDVNVYDRLTTDQKETLTLFKNRCERNGRSPNQSDVDAIQKLEPGLDQILIFAWLEAAFVQSTESTSASELTPSSTGSSSYDALTDVEAAVLAYARERNNKPCGNCQAAGKSPNRRFRCTTGCHYSTNDDDTWRRHVLGKYPTQFWFCHLCKQAGRKQYICHRKNHMQKHLESVHHEDVAQGLNIASVRDESRVYVNADFPRTCPFESLRCRVRFSSMREYMEHCLQHFREGSFFHFDDDDGDFKDDRPNRDHDQNPGGSSGSGSYGTYLVPKFHGGQGSKGGGASSSCMPQSSPYYRNTSGNIADPADKEQQISSSDVQRDLSHGPRSRLPNLLVDVESQTLGKPPSNLPPSDVKYLALEYSWAMRHDPGLAAPTITCPMKSKTDVWELHHIPKTFARAMSLTKDMGYQYLWIAGLCQTAETTDQQLASFERATLTIFIVGSGSSPDHIWHFACHYSKIPDLRSWNAGNEPNIFKHVQILGHGSYGIVDQVQLRSTKQVFARKTLLSWKMRTLRANHQLQEIETWQKLNHPGLSNFIAAYYLKNSLNILMEPVAECDLKHFLAEPDRWPEKRRYVPQWFHALASALAYMHGLSCRHKDIKPANILVSGSKVVLSDFGTARDFPLDKSESCGGALMTPKYCAPEVAFHQRRGRKSDIFSLGCVFLELITVDLDIPLVALERSITANTIVRKRGTYCRNLPIITSWLSMLRNRTTSPYRLTVLKMCERMLERDELCRPSAQEVCEALAVQPLHVPISRPSALFADHTSPRSALAWTAAASNNRPLQSFTNFSIDLQVMPSKPLAPTCTRNLQTDSNALVALWISSSSTATKHRLFGHHDNLLQFICILSCSRRNPMAEDVLVAAFEYAEVDLAKSPFCSEGISKVQMQLVRQRLFGRLAWPPRLGLTAQDYHHWRSSTLRHQSMASHNGDHETDNPTEKTNPVEDDAGEYPLQSALSREQRPQCSSSTALAQDLFTSDVGSILQHDTTAADPESIVVKTTSAPSKVKVTFKEPLKPGRYSAIKGRTNVPGPASTASGSFAAPNALASGSAAIEVRPTELANRYSKHSVAPCQWSCPFLPKQRDRKNGQPWFARSMAVQYLIVSSCMCPYLLWFLAFACMVVSFGGYMPALPDQMSLVSSDAAEPFADVVSTTEATTQPSRPTPSATKNMPGRYIMCQLTSSRSVACDTPTLDRIWDMARIHNLTLCWRQ